MAVLTFHFMMLLLNSICNAQFQPLPINTATLTTSTTTQNGATITILDSNVVSSSIMNDRWTLDIPSSMRNANTDQLGWDMLLNLNESWGFHPSKQSSIILTIYSDQSTGGNDKDIIVSFSVDNSQYFSIFISLDNGVGNAIGPTCGGSLFSGDINNAMNSNPNTDREDKAFGGATGCCCECNGKSQRLQPQGTGYRNYWPITLKITNNPTNDRLYITMTNSQISPLQQSCEYRDSFTTNKGLQIYIGSDEVGDEAVYLKQFQIDYEFELTYPPTNNPTKTPTLPTQVPTMSPSTPNPTVTPSKNPTMVPTTKSPSLSPVTTTSNPTATPSRIPTILPTTKNPVLSPVDDTPSPINNEGSINDEQSTTNIGDGERKKSVNTSTDELDTIYYILSGLLICCCLCCILVIFYVQRRKKKQSKIQHSVQPLSNTKRAQTQQKYGDKMQRLSSVSHTNTLNTNTISVNEISSEPQHFQNNLTSAVGVNNMLMDDIVEDMNNNDGNDKVTPRLPAPPKRMISLSNQSDNIEMAQIITPQNGDDDTDEIETNDITDESKTNENEMDDDDDMDMEIIDDIILTENEGSDNIKFNDYEEEGGNKQNDYIDNFTPQ